MMSHISKGDVHAYLDGALSAYPDEVARHVREHLDTCAECAQVLTDERRVRQEASAILADSAQGSVELDPLEELLARAAIPDLDTGGVPPTDGVERTEWSRPSMGRRTQMLGWAATVVISLGSGWMARGLTGPAGERDNVGRIAEAESSREAPSAEAAEVNRAVEALGVVGGSADSGSPETDNDAALDQVQESNVQRQGFRGPPRDPQTTSLSDELRESSVPSAPAPGRSDAAVRSRFSAPTMSSASGLSTVFLLVPGLSVRDVRVVPNAEGLMGAAVGEPTGDPVGDAAGDAAPGSTASPGSTVVVTQELPDGRLIEIEFVPLSGSDPGGESALQKRTEIDSRALPEGWAVTVRDVPGGVAALSGPLAEPELAGLLDLALRRR